MTEIFDLEAADRHTLIDEIARASARLKTWAHADKINVGALGNVVRQLHVHIVARKKDDPAGAAPIWGVGETVRYSDEDLARVASEMSAAFK